LQLNCKELHITHCKQQRNIFCNACCVSLDLSAGQYHGAHFSLAQPSLTSTQQLQCQREAERLNHNATAQSTAAAAAQNMSQFTFSFMDITIPVPSLHCNGSLARLGSQWQAHWARKQHQAQKTQSKQ
jgi:hypothetical protein